MAVRAGQDTAPHLSHIQNMNQHDGRNGTALPEVQDYALLTTPPPTSRHFVLDRDGLCILMLRSEVECMDEAGAEVSQAV